MGDGAASNQIIIARAQQCRTLDPLMAEDTASTWIFGALLEGLVRNSDDRSGVEPCLATSWIISDDGLTYTFHLIPNLRFADGTPVTPEDWIWTFERAMEDIGGLWSFAAENFQSVTFSDDNTLVLTLRQQNPATLSHLAMFTLAVQSKAHYEEYGGYESAAPLGCGPYYVPNWSGESELVMRKNAYYRRAGYPLTEQIKWITVSDDNTRISLLQTGQVDIITDVPYLSMNNLNKTEGVRAIGLPSTTNRYLLFNTTTPPLSNKLVRQALLLGTDKEEFVEQILCGYGEAAVSYMPQNGPYWNDDIQPVAYDPDKARQLLAETGYTDGFVIDLYVREDNVTFQQIANLIQRQWGKIGVTIRLIYVDTAQLLQMQYNLSCPMVLGSWTSDVYDPAQINHYFFDYPISHGFYTGYRSLQATSLFQHALDETSPQQRERDYLQLQEVVYEDVPLINLYQEQIPVAMRTNIQGYHQNPLGAYCLTQLVKVVEE